MSTTNPTPALAEDVERFRTVPVAALKGVPIDGAAAVIVTRRAGEVVYEAVSSMPLELPVVGRVEGSADGALTVALGAYWIDAVNAGTASISLLSPLACPIYSDCVGHDMENAECEEDSAVLWSIDKSYFIDTRSHEFPLRTVAPIAGTAGVQTQRIVRGGVELDAVYFPEIRHTLTDADDVAALAEDLRVASSRLAAEAAEMRLAKARA